MNSIIEKDHLSVLIVDDEPFQRRIVREVLRNLGFVKTKDADSGELAIAKMREQRFNLVLSDVQMPGMNGLELLRQIRIGQTKLPRDTRFVILTSFSNTEVLGAAMALDVNGFLAKPIRIGVVLEKIDRAVQEIFHLRAEDEYKSVETNLPSLERAQRESAAALARDVLAFGINEKIIPLMQLGVGMRVTKSVYAADGTLLISAGTVLTRLFINRLWDLSSVLTDELVHIAHVRGEQSLR
jgi:CheY-like chemotaxis protein